MGTSLAVETLGKLDYMISGPLFPQQGLMDIKPRLSSLFFHNTNSDWHLTVLERNLQPHKPEKVNAEYGTELFMSTNSQF